MASLGYFICPIDAIPDFLPGGFIDNLAVLGVVFREACVCSTPSVKKRVEELLPGWAKSDHQDDILNLFIQKKWETVPGS